MKPILYTFRRCPYAIRARLAIAISEVDIEMYQVELRNKPQSLLDCSPKGTVPVLKFADGTVIEQSLDIMLWALRMNDPQSWINGEENLSIETLELIKWNDGEFKYYLDRYKYADRYPEYSQIYYRQQGEKFLTELNSRLSKQAYLTDKQLRFADMAIFPFIRQFAHVDKEWFYASPYSFLIKWLDEFLQSDLFATVMQK